MLHFPIRKALVNVTLLVSALLLAGCATKQPETQKNADKNIRVPLTAEDCKLAENDLEKAMCALATLNPQVGSYYAEYRKKYDRTGTIKFTVSLSVQGRVLGINVQESTVDDQKFVDGIMSIVKTLQVKGLENKIDVYYVYNFNE